MERSVAGARRDAVVNEARGVGDSTDRPPLSHIVHGAAQRELIRTVIVDDHEEIARLVAKRIATLIREKGAKGEPIVLGLATGSTPIGIYRELIRMHRDEGLSFKNVVTFNLDEYYPEIVRAGGIDFQILGIGKTGHIGFNEPGSGADSRTRLVTLDAVTRKDAAADFFGEEFVPREAVTLS